MKIDMKKQRSITTLQYISLTYAILYILFIWSSDFNGAYPKLSAEGIGVYLLFVLFVIGVSISWYSKKLTGILFLIWYAGMMFLELVIVEKDGGFGIITGIPLLILGILFFRKGNKLK